MERYSTLLGGAISLGLTIFVAQNDTFHPNRQLIQKQRMTKRLYIILSVLLASMAANAAYGDHRGRKVDSLEHVLRTNPPADKVELLRLYDNLACGFLEIDGAKTQAYSDRGIALAKEVEGYKVMANFYRLKGMCYWGEARYDEAEKMLRKASETVALMEKSGKYSEGDVDDMASAVWGTLGNLFNSLGSGAKALEYYHKALRLFKKHEWRESETLAYHNMAELYLCMGNLERAEEYFAWGDSVAQLTHDDYMFTHTNRGLAKVRMMQGNTAEAWRYISKVADYLFAHPDEEGSSRVTCLHIMADIAFSEGDYAKARQLVGRNELLCDSLQMTSAGLLSQKAQLAVFDKAWDEAERLALAALDADSESPELTCGTYKLLAEIYTNMGKADKARLFAEKADSVQTTWSNYAYQTSLSEQEMLFESEQKDSQISSLSKQRMYLMWVVIVAVLLIFVLCCVFVLLKRNHRRQKELLATQVALDTETKERSILAKDLHDGLGGMLTLLKLKLANKEQDEAIKLLDDSIVEMRRMAHHIMPDELQRNGLVTSLQDFAISVPGAHFHHFGEERRLAKDAELVLYRCAYELVNNAMKHSGADRIDIQLMVEKEQVTLSVSDNGKGFDLEEQTSGVGLQNIRGRIAQFDGQMNIISSLNQGTEVNIILPSV